MTTVEQNPDSSKGMPVDPNVLGLGLSFNGEGILPQFVSSKTRYLAEQRGLHMDTYVNQQIWEQVVSEAQTAPEMPDKISGFTLHIRGLFSRIKEAFHNHDSPSE